MVSLSTPSFDSVARYSHDLSRGSSVGAIVTSRSGGEYDNHVAGFDSTLRLSSRDTVVAQILGSTTRYPGQVAEEFGQRHDRFSGSALHLGYAHATRRMEYWADYDDISDTFRADLGFMPQVGYRELGYAWSL